MGDNHAVIVGLTRYPGITDLSGAENDARWFQQWLLDHKLVDASNIALIISSDFAPQPNATSDEKATRNARPGTGAVDSAFERIIGLGGDSGVVGDRLYLFFSGHGVA